MRLQRISRRERHNLCIKVRNYLLSKSIGEFVTIPEILYELKSHNLEYNILFHLVQLFVRNKVLYRSSRGTYMITRLDFTWIDNFKDVSQRNETINRLLCSFLEREIIFSVNDLKKYFEQHGIEIGRNAVVKLLHILELNGRIIAYSGKRFEVHMS